MELSRTEAIIWLGIRAATSTLEDPDSGRVFAQCMLALGCDPLEIADACRIGLYEPD